MDLGNIKYNMKSNIKYNITGLVFDLVQRLDMIFTINTPSNSMQCESIIFGNTIFLQNCRKI